MDGLPRRSGMIEKGKRFVRRFSTKDIRETIRAAMEEGPYGVMRFLETWDSDFDVYSMSEFFLLASSKGEDDMAAMAELALTKHFVAAADRRLASVQRISSVKECLFLAATVKVSESKEVKELWRRNITVSQEAKEELSHSARRILEGGSESIKDRIDVAEFAGVEAGVISSLLKVMKPDEKEQVRRGTLDTLAARSVSLLQMLEFYNEKVVTFAGMPEATTAEVVKTVVLPLTDQRKCSTSTFMKPDPNSMPKRTPHYHIVHPWGMKHKDLLSAVVYHASNYTTRELRVKELKQSLLENKISCDVLHKRYFFCAHVLNQHTVESYEHGDPRCEVDSFDEVARMIHEDGGSMLVVLDERLSTLSRVWCLDEIHEAFIRNMNITFTFSQFKKLEDGDFLPVQQCGATQQADKERILAKIQYQKSFNAFDRDLKKFVTEHYAKILERLQKA